MANGFSMTLLTTFDAPFDRPLSTCALFTVLLIVGPGAAWPCEPPGRFRVPVDRPITVFSDGSFLDASADDEWSFLRGRPVRDVGGGRVGQVLEEDPVCDLEQQLLFVDCTSGAAIIVDGREPEEVIWTEDGTYLAALALHLQLPHGPLALTASTTVAEVAAIAARGGWTVEPGVPAYAAERGRRNAFAPFIGCEMFYPGSVGAGR